MSDVMKEVDELKSSAKASRDSQKYEDALEDLDEAIELLLLEPLDDHTQSKKVIAQLADCYGMKGGIYRRLNETTEALKMYGLGLEYEEKLGRDSYNRSNWIALNLASGVKSVSDLDGDIRRAAKLVEEQVRFERKGQWWAWADLALFRLLLSQPDEAMTAYRSYQTTGARAEDYTTTIQVLELLARSLAGASQVEGIHRAIKFLQEKKSELERRPSS